MCPCGVNLKYINKYELPFVPLNPEYPESPYINKNNHFII